MKDDDDRYEFDDDENEESRSIFSATWFRVVLATVAVGVIAAVGLPYMLGSGTSAPEKTASVPPPLLDTKPAASLAPSPAGPDAPGALVTVTPPSGSPAPAPALAPLAPATSVGPERSAAPARSPVPSSPPPARPVVAEAPRPAPDVAPAPRAKPDERVASRVQAKPTASKPPAQVRAAAAAKPSSVKGAATRKAYYVQVGTFKDPAAARRLAAKLRDQKPAVASRPVTIADSSDRLSRVRVGPFPDRAAAVSTVRTLQGQGFKPFVVNYGA